MSNNNPTNDKGNDSEKKVKSTIRRSPPEPTISDSGEYKIFVREDDGGSRTVCISRVDGTEIPWAHEEFLKSLYDEYPTYFAKRARQDRFEIQLGQYSAWEGVDADIVDHLVEAL